MNPLMRQRAGGTLLLVIVVCLVPSFVLTQESSGKRRIVEHSAPAYPALAKSMALSGAAKVEALVAPDGTVKNVEIRGGHPVLAQAAASAVRRWHWEPAAQETRELVEIKFNPE